ncbi:MAG: hypothetical protein IIY06_08935 [Proteobacteria bacterium]|nr:hypothetical protein [Pseudomonadota bacterium]
MDESSAHGDKTSCKGQKLWRENVVIAEFMNMVPNAFEITILVLAMLFIIVLMNMFKISDKLARAIVKKDKAE